MDARYLGQDAPHDRRARRAAEASAADLANATLVVAIGAGARLCPGSARPTRSPTCSPTRSINTQRSLDITQNQYTAGTPRKSDVITAQALVLAAQAQEINIGVARAQNEHAIAVLIGRPPAGLTIPHGKLAYDIPHCAGRACLGAAGAPPDIAAAERTMQAAERGDRRRDRRLLSRRLADAARSAIRGDPFIKRIAARQSGLVLRPVARADAVQRRADRRAGRSRRRPTRPSVATYRQTVLTAFQQVEDQLAAMPILTPRDSTVQARRSRPPNRRCRSRSTNIGRHAEFHHRGHGRGDGAWRRGIGARRPGRSACSTAVSADRRAGRRLDRSKAAAQQIVAPARRSVGQADSAARRLRPRRVRRPSGASSPRRARARTSRRQRRGPAGSARGGPRRQERSIAARAARSSLSRVASISATAAARLGDAARGDRR